jgi:hypothetical protein
MRLEAIVKTSSLGHGSRQFHVNYFGRPLENCES